MMRVVVNAVALRSAGGRSVAINFLRACEKQAGHFELEVFAPANCGYEKFSSAENIRVHIVPDRLNKTLLRPVVDRYWLSKRIDALHPDVVFSMGNFAVPTKHKQVVLFMWPYATYPDSEIWDRLPWKDIQTRKAKIATFRNRLKYAEVVTPQTLTSAKRLRKYYPQIEHIRVIPTAVAFTGYRQALSGIRKAHNWDDGRKKLLCLTRYYPHKNLEILIDVALRIKQKKMPYSIITTIAKEQHSGADLLLKEIERRNLGHIIQNIGPVPMDEVPALYDVTDGLILPTLLESFSGTYVDAMKFEKPIFTSDRDFAQDVCGDVAFYFDPLSVDDILTVIDDAFETPGVIPEKCRGGSLRVDQLPDWNDVANMYLSLLKQTANNAIHSIDDMSMMEEFMPVHGDGSAIPEDRISVQEGSTSVQENDISTTQKNRSTSDDDVLVTEDNMVL